MALQWSIPKTVNRFFFVPLIALASLLNGCTGYPRLLSFPFDSGGRSLNSSASELTPHVASPYVVFVSDRNGSQDIYLYEAQNKRIIDLPGLNSFDELASSPSISEDGRYIVFAASRQGRSGIFLYDRNTQQKRNLTPTIQAEVRNPTISGDGETIAFEVGINGQWDIVICDRRGQQLPIPGTPRVIQ